ncbi:MAG: phosphoribosylanthranilate isomerase [Trueperaceae bacterium]|nr:phosphoribosylanthranilate isomerase [Trueperaceae bacterium]
MRIKICGLTRPEDAVAAEAAGADALGLIFAERSKRYVTPDRAKEISDAVGPFVTRVGVFVDAPLDTVREAVGTVRLDAVQLHGSEDDDYMVALRPEVRVIKALSFTPGLTPEVLDALPVDGVLLDGLVPGSGSSFDWSQAVALRGLPNLILAGGLDAANVAAGIRALRPYGVDVASGVEAAPGVKHAEKMRAFVRAARAAELSTTP